MLIRNATLLDQSRCDVRLAGGHVQAIASTLPTQDGERVIEAQGGVLLPGLHDHHLHLFSLAAALESVPCGPPAVHDVSQLAATLQARAQSIPKNAWIRGVGYHESVAGELDALQLDRWLPEQPLRIQHRSGRLWLLNSAALALLVEHGQDDPLERIDGRLTGRLYDADDWLRRRLAAKPRRLDAVSRLLAGYGVTGVTDTTPHNTPMLARDFFAAQQRGELLQDLLLMGDASLDDWQPSAASPRLPRLRRGAHKFHLHEHDLPDFGWLCDAIRRSHATGRGAAFHCVTRTDLVFALEALRVAGAHPGDRIEHASVVPPELLERLTAQRVPVVVQPHFIAERGEAYRSTVDADDLPWLYRLRGLQSAGVSLAAGSDAPFGDANPWAAMQAAVSRRTAMGRVMAADEALSPEAALALFMAPAEDLHAPPRTVHEGAVADLCLLTQPWEAVRSALDQVLVQLTLRRGTAIYYRREDSHPPG